MMKINPPEAEQVMTFTSGGIVSQEPVTFQTPDIVARSTVGLNDLARAQYKPIGAYIYCGTTENLTREHIIPFGLSGTAVLPAASCKNCSKITSTVELEVLRGPMRSVRVLRKLKSRSNHAGAPSTQGLKILRNEKHEIVQLPLEEYPILLHFFTFSPPGILTGRLHSGIEITGVSTISFGPDPKTVGRRLGAKKILHDAQPDHPIPFARMIAKIAYAMAVAQSALSPAEHRPEIVASILGELDEIGRWVGTSPGPFHKYPEGTLHRITMHQEPNGRLMAEVQLFADSATPTYLVVLR